MATQVVCSKERELGIMATEIKNIKETTDRLESKMDKFIIALEDKVNKKELSTLQAGLRSVATIAVTALLAVIGFLLKITLFK